MFGIFNKPHANLMVREIVFTYVIEQAEPLGVSGLAEIMIGKKFLPYEFTLKCCNSEITADEVKKHNETFWYCNHKTTVVDTVRGSSTKKENIRFCKA